MAFSAETKVFTDKGWKSIADISGKDRVLVRNFLGDAEFRQPFYLKKKEYDGEIVNFGSKYWAVSVTPEHQIVYDGEREPTLAQDVTVDRHRLLFRKFRYTREDKAKEILILKNGDSHRYVSISDEDWYTVVAFAVTKGYISKDKNPRLKFFVNMDNLLPLVDVLDRWGISWTSRNVDGNIALTVNRDNNLARKLKVFLGARARRDMRLPKKMLYSSSQGLMKHFLGTVTTLTAKPSQKRPKQLIFTSYNTKLIESLRLMCMLVGYGFSSSRNVNGEHVAYILPTTVSPWSVRFIEKKTYSGYIYEIGLFEGLVYVTEKSLPVWMSPK